MAEKAVAWTDTRALALARQPGVHKHPTEQGFLMQVSPKGHAVYRWRFTNAKGEEDTGKFGTVGAVSGGGYISLEDALEKFKEKRAADNSRKKHGAITLQIAFEEWSKHAKKGGTPKAEATLEYYEICYNRYIKDEAQHWELSYTTSDAWDALLTKVKARSLSRARGTFWLLHGIYNLYVVDKELVASNPLSKGRLKAKFSGDDSKRVVKTHIAAIDLEAFVTSTFALTSRVKKSQDAILFLLLTGWRRSAVFQMKWAAIDFERCTYTVVRRDEDDKRDLGNAQGWKWFRGEIAIGNQAMGILRERKAKGGEAESIYVFPARHGDKPHMTDIRGSLETVCKKMGYRVTPHDLRRTFATIAEVVLDGNLRLVGRLMAHSQPGSKDASATTAKYVVGNLQAECVSASRVESAILEIANALPLDDDTAEAFAKRGIDIKKLPLIELDDDDV